MSPDERLRWYRESGWWPGERLEDRYARIVAERPEGTAVVDDQGRRLSHAQLWQATHDLAAELAARGVSAGDVVLITLPNQVSWQVGFLAALRLRAIPATLPVRTDPETVAYVVALAAARALIVSERHGDTPTGDMARDVAARSAHAVDVVVMDARGAWTWTASPIDATPSPPDVPGLDHLMFTSSTTGRPKAVMHSADTLAALNQTFSERFDLGAERPIFMASPLGHSVGAIHGARLALYTGAPLVLQDRWDAEAAIAAIAEHGCDFTAAATPFLKDLVDVRWRGAGAKLAPMRSFLCGGAQVPPALMEQAGEQFPQTFVTVLWGMTEGGLTTCVPGCDRQKQLTTAGSGLPGLELRVLAPDGATLAAGEEGELAMRGPGVFIGYLRQDALYRSSLTEDGFFRTGDLARIDADGFVQITGRQKDLIIRGGVNISPVPVEDALAAHPNVASVAVIGFPDERLGERICAVIVPAGEPPSLDALIGFVAARGLPKHSWPESVRYVDDMPRTAAGKIRKIQLRDSIVGADSESVRARG